MSAGPTQIKFNMHGGELVELPLELFQKFSTTIQDAVEAHGASSEPIQMDLKEYEALAIQKVFEYLRLDVHSSGIPTPLGTSLSSYITDSEVKFLEEVEEQQLVPQVINLAYELAADDLKKVMAAHVAEKIDEIAKAAPDIMTGAEHIREYLNMENPWTEEEMVHLHREMDLVKELDENAY